MHSRRTERRVVGTYKDPIRLTGTRSLLQVFCNWRNNLFINFFNALTLAEAFPSCPASIRCFNMNAHEIGRIELLQWRPDPLPHNLCRDILWHPLPLAPPSGQLCHASKKVHSCDHRPFYTIQGFKRCKRRSFASTPQPYVCSSSKAFVTSGSIHRMILQPHLTMPHYFGKKSTSSSAGKGI